MNSQNVTGEQLTMQLIDSQIEDIYLELDDLKQNIHLIQKQQRIMLKRLTEIQKLAELPVSLISKTIPEPMPVALSAPAPEPTLETSESKLNHSHINEQDQKNSKTSNFTLSLNANSKLNTTVNSHFKPYLNLITTQPEQNKLNAEVIKITNSEPPIIHRPVPIRPSDESYSHKIKVIQKFIES